MMLSHAKQSLNSSNSIAADGEGRVIKLIRDYPILYWFLLEEEPRGAGPRSLIRTVYCNSYSSQVLTKLR